MNYRLRLFCLAITMVGAFALPSAMYGQIFNGQQQEMLFPTLQKQLRHWEIYRMDAAALHGFVEHNFQAAPVRIQLGQHHWQLALTPNTSLLGPNYSLQVLTDRGLESIKPTTPKAFKGNDLVGGGQTRLTLDDDFIYGFVEENGERYYVEPLWYYVPEAAHDLFVLYAAKDVNRDIDATCAVVESEEHLQHLQNSEPVHENSQAEFMACYQVEIAIAADRSMFLKYGSTAGVEDHNIGVINNTEVDYTSGSFNHNLFFVIVTQFVSTVNGPWTNSTDAGTLLDSFVAWANANGFGESHDIGELWTDRDFDGGTVGIAYLDAVCTNHKYHCLQDFTSNGELLRCMTSHEIGHNFSCEHDGGATCPPNFIMCPFVSTTSQWSPTSIAAVNSFIVPLINNGCLSSCGGTPVPLVADFDWSPTQVCAGVAVHFDNLSSGSITGYSWVFTSAVPGSSNQSNPTATWNNPGTFNVKLTLTGDGGPVSITKQITVQPRPTADFNYTVSGTTIFLNNISNNANSYSWSFGDGNTSTDDNPTYTYNVAGTYMVQLTATNSCGTASQSVTLTTEPTADFTSTQATGCTPLNVQFTNLSSVNIDSYVWQFPGGSPSSSIQHDPNVQYNTAGTYPVTLTVTNIAGSSTITRTGYVVVSSRPTAAFSSTVNNATASFTNTSSNATSYSWNFGDNTTGNIATPSHTYATDGTYTVVLTTTNNCGTNTATHTVTIATLPTASFTENATTGCGPLTVQFNAASSLNAQTFNWQFPGGMPSSSTAQNPTIIYNTPGTYSVTLTVNNGSGSNTTTQTNLIIVNPSPTAAFSSTLTGTTAAFSNTSTNSTTYSWNFGDNASATTATPSHTYTADGTYTVILTATNACGTSTATHTVVIATSPTANFTATNTTGCGPLTVQFTSSSSANVQTFNWQFPGGTPSSSTVQNPVVIYNTAGTYSVTLTVSNAAGNNTTTQTNLVVINPSPAAAFSSTLAGTTAAFSNTSTNSTTYSWNFGDNTSATTATPSHTYTADGTYTVVLTATNACGTSTATHTVVIATSPTANFTATNTTGCGPLTVQFTSSSSANAQTFNWQFPGGTPSSSTVQNPVVVYNTAGTYSVTLTVSNAAGNNTTTQTNLIVVNPSPAAAFSSTLTGTTAAFSNTSTNSTTYSWNFGDNTSATTATPSHTYTADGTYTVVLTATNACGTSTATHTVVIATSPTANFTATNTTGCGPLTVQFTSSSSANVQTFNWQFPGGTPSSSTVQNPVVVYNTAGTYSVTLTVSNAAGNNTTTQTNLVVVNPSPAVDFSSTLTGTTAAFSNTSTNSTTYAWNFGDNTSATTATPSHTYTADGTYLVTLTATNACGTSTATHTVVIATSPTANFTATNTTGCGPLTVQFTSSSSANTQTFNWQFPGGTPSSSTVQNPVVIYNTAGTYSVTLTVSNAAGNNTTTQTSLVVVNPSPAAAFSSTLTGTTAAFSNTSTNSTTYAWNFGDNTIATTATPSHTYTADGTYTVVLTATNACGTSTATHTVVIATSPTANFTATNTTGCGPLTVQFTSSSSANVQTFNWQFPGGTPSSSTGQNPVVIYNTAGTYSVTLTVSNAAGNNTTTQTNLVVVSPSPTAAFSSTLTGTTAAFSNTSINSTTYSWNFGDNTSATTATPSHTYTADGTYLVTLTATNACGSNVFTQNVVVITSPSAGFAASTTTGCAALTVQFSDLSSGNTTSWNWTFPGGTPATSTVQNPVVVYNTPGTYDVTLVASTIAGSNTYAQAGLITILGMPTAAFTSTHNGAIISFSNNSANATTYHWDFGDGSSSSDSSPTHTYVNNGLYQAVLLATNNCGSITYTQEITVSTAPTAAFTVSGTKGCAPFTVHFTNQSSSNATTFTWTFEGGNPDTSSVPNPSVTFSQPGNYNVLLLVSNGSGTDTASTIITVTALPATAFTIQPAGLSVAFTNTSTNGTTYEWKFGDGATSTTLNPVHNYAGPGTYTVELTVTNSCGAATLQHTFTITTVDASEPNWLSQFRVYPNPNEGHFTVEMQGTARQEVEFALFNVVGQLVHREVADFGTGNLHQLLDCTNLPAAVYTLRISSGQQSTFVKIVVQR